MAAVALLEVHQPAVPWLVAAECVGGLPCTLVKLSPNPCALEDYSRTLLYDSAIPWRTAIPDSHPQPADRRVLWMTPWEGLGGRGGVHCAAGLEQH